MSETYWKNQEEQYLNPLVNDKRSCVAELLGGVGGSLWQNRKEGKCKSKYLKTIYNINCLPWKVGKYKSCYHNCYASIKVDEEADVTLHLLQVSIVHAFHHGTQQEGDSHLGEKEIIFSLYSSHPQCIEHLSY